MTTNATTAAIGTWWRLPAINVSLQGRTSQVYNFRDWHFDAAGFFFVFSAGDQESCGGNVAIAQRIVVSAAFEVGGLR
jgi:hypothetical protein